MSACDLHADIYSNFKFASKFPRIPPTKGRDTLVVWMPSFPYLPHTLIYTYSTSTDLWLVASISVHWLWTL